MFARNRAGGGAVVGFTLGRLTQSRGELHRPFEDRLHLVVAAPDEEVLGTLEPSSSTGAPAATSASWSRTLWSNGAIVSAVPCWSSTGGASARARRGTRDCSTSSGTVLSGAPSHFDGKSLAGSSSASAEKSVIGYQHTMPCTGSTSVPSPTAAAR